MNLNQLYTKPSLYIYQSNLDEETNLDKRFQLFITDSISSLIEI